MDDKFKKKSRKLNSSPSLTSLNISSSSFRKTDQGTYYFPNGEVFRPRVAPAKRNRPSKIKGMNINTNVTSPNMGGGGFVVGNSPIAPGPSPSPNPGPSPHMGSIPPSPNPSLSRTSSITSNTFNPGYLTKNPNHATTKLKKSDLAQSLRSSKNDTPTNILLVNKQQYQRKEGYKNNYLMKQDFVLSPYDHDNLQPTSLMMRNNKSLTNLSDSNPSSLSNYTLNRSASNTPQTSINTLSDEGDGIEDERVNESETYLPKVNEEDQSDPIPEPLNNKASLYSNDLMVDSATVHRIESSSSTANETLKPQLPILESLPSLILLESPSKSLLLQQSRKSLEQEISKKSLDILKSLILEVKIPNSLVQEQKLPSPILLEENLPNPVVLEPKIPVVEQKKPKSLLLTAETPAAVPPAKASLLPVKTPVKSVLPVKALPVRTPVKSMILPEISPVKSMIPPETTPVKAAPAVDVSPDAVPGSAKSELASVGDGAFYTADNSSIDIATEKNSIKTLSPTSTPLPDTLESANGDSYAKDVTKLTSPDYPEPTIIDNTTENSHTTLSFKSEKSPTIPQNLDTTIITNTSISNPTTPQRAYFDFENNEQFKTFIEDGQFVPPRGDVEIMGEMIRISERSTSFTSSMSGSSGSISKRNSSINGLLSPTGPRSPLSTSFDNAWSKPDHKDEKVVTGQIYPPPILDNQVFNNKSLPPSPVRSLRNSQSSNVSSPNKIISPSPLNNTTPPSPSPSPSPALNNMKAPRLNHKPSIASSIEKMKLTKNNSFVRSTSTANFKSMFKKMFKSDNEVGNQSFSSMSSLVGPNSVDSLNKEPEVMDSIDSSPSPKPKISSPFISSHVFESSDSKPKILGKTKKVFSLSGLKGKKSNSNLNSEKLPESDNKPLPDLNFRKSLLFTLEDFTLEELPDIETDNNLFDDVLNDFEAKLNDKSQSPIKLHEMLGNKKSKSIMNDPFLNDDELTRDQIEDQRKKDFVEGSQESLPEDDKRLSRANSNDLYVDDNIRYLQQEIVWTIDNNGDLQSADQRKRISRITLEKLDESSTIVNDNDTQTIIVSNDELVDYYKSINELDRRYLPMHLKHISQFQDFDSLEINIKKFEYLRNSPFHVNIPSNLSPILKKQVNDDGKPTGKKVEFSNKISINETFPPEMYKRYNKSVTQYNLTESSQFIHIKNEINFFKCNEMLVHEHSQNNTHFFY